MKKILIGTHNKGKFREIAYLLSNKIKKFLRLVLRYQVQKRQKKLFQANSKLKAECFFKIC